MIIFVVPNLRNHWTEREIMKDTAMPHVLIVAALSATLLVLTSPLALGATGAPARPLDPCGGVDHYVTWTGVTKPWVITHATRYEHFTTGTDTRAYTASEQAQLTAGVTFSVSGNLSANAAIISLGATTNATFAVSGQKTVATGVTVTSTMSHFAAYVFYRGNHKAGGSFTYYVCGPTGHSLVVNSRGTASSWDVLTEGALDCTTSPPATSLGYLVKPR